MPADKAANPATGKEKASWVRTSGSAKAREESFQTPSTHFLHNLIPDARSTAHKTTAHGTDKAASTIQVSRVKAQEGSLLNSQMDMMPTSLSIAQQKVHIQSSSAAAQTEYEMSSNRTFSASIATSIASMSISRTLPHRTRNQRWQVRLSKKQRFTPDPRCCWNSPHSSATA